MRALAWPLACWLVLLAATTPSRASELLAQVSELSQRAALAKGMSALAPGDALAVLRSAAGQGSRLRDEMDALLMEPLWTEDLTNFDYYEVVFPEKRTLGILFGELGDTGVVVKDLSAKGDARRTGRVSNGDELVAINMKHVHDLPITDIGDHITEGAYPKVFRFRRRRGGNGQGDGGVAAAKKPGPKNTRSNAKPGSGASPALTVHPDGTFSVSIGESQGLGLGIMEDLLISSVKPTSPLHGIVRVGDRLVAVADANVQDEALPDVARRIKTAAAPFTLRFATTDGRNLANSGGAAAQHRPQADAAANHEAEDEPEEVTHLGADGELVLTSPPILAGARYSVRFASFGEASTCGERNVSMHIDSPGPGRLGMACGKKGPAVPYAAKDSLVFVLRGDCTFVTKARNVLDAGGSGMIVVTRDFEPLATMPAGAGELRRGPIQGPAVMMGWKDGNGLLGLLRKGPLRAILRGPHCSSAASAGTSGAESAAADDDKDDDDEYAVEVLEGGRTRNRHAMASSVELLVWDSATGETRSEIGVLGDMGGVTYKSFPRVSGAEPTVLVLAPGEKGKACEAFPKTGQFDGALVVAWRGECSFADKALNVQKAGGAGLVLVNADPGANKLHPIMIQPELVKAVKIPGMMVTPAAGERLRAIIAGPGADADAIMTAAAPAPPLVIAKFFRKTLYYCDRIKGVLCGYEDSG